MDYYNNSTPGYFTDGQAVDNKVSAVMKKVYVKMFLALLVSAAAALIGFFAGENSSIAMTIATNK